MVWIGETHPAKPIGIGVKRFQPSNGPIGNPISVIPLARDVIDVGLGSASVSATKSTHLEFHIQHAVVHGNRLWMIFHQPLGIVKCSHATMSS